MKKIIAFFLVLCVFSLAALPIREGDLSVPDENSAVVSSEEIIAEADGTVSEEEILSSFSSVNGKIICIDPGHCIYSSNRTEPIAPNSSITKPAFVSGTHGVTLTEEQLNLTVALKLQQRLADEGAVVLMTRQTHESDMSNVDRAKMANEASADLVIRIHADGSENSSVHGISMLLPSGKYISDEEMLKKSRCAGELILEEVVKSTGAKNNGTVERPDMTGFNWSTVPVVLLEMGFMTNPEEDRLLSSEDYQNKIINGITAGICAYFEQITEDVL